MAAMAVLRTPLIMGMARSNRTHMFLGGMVALTLLNNVLSSQPYTPGTVGTKHLPWLSICSVVAVMVAPGGATAAQGCSPHRSNVGGSRSRGFLCSL